MAKSAGRSRKLMWVMILLLTLSSSAAAVALFMVFDQRDASAEETSATVERRAPIFLSIEPFTVNVADDDYGTRLLYTGITLKLGDEESRELLEEYRPQVRSRLLTLFSGQQASALTSSEDKQRLAKDIIDVLETPLETNQAPLAIEDVLFTEFIVQ